MKNIFIIGILALTVACSPADNAPKTSAANPSAATVIEKAAVATVDGEVVSQEIVDYFREARYRGAEVTAEQSAAMLDDITQLYALASAATAQGLDVENQVEMKMDLQRKSMLAQLLVQKFTADNPITEEDVRAVYDSGVGGDEYKARHILVNEEATAKNLIAQLDEGADFATLAKENSTGPSAEKGGMLGDWFPATQMVKPFAEALPGIAPGTYSKSPVQTQFGWHVIKVEENRQLPFDQAKTQIMEKMRNDNINEFITSIKNSAQIELKP